VYTLEQVRCFVAVAEELHFGRAAERLGMTQPPLSRQVQRLERILKTTLLHRDHRNVDLTSAGRAFLGESYALLAAAERAPEIAQKVAAGYEGIVRLGFTAAAGFGILGRLLKRFSHELPGVQIELSEMVTGAQVTALQSSGLDLGIGRPPVDPEHFRSRLLLAEDLVLAAPEAAEIEMEGDVVSAAVLPKLPLIMHSPVAARYFYDLCVRLFAFDHAKVVYTADQIPTIMALVRAGLGFAYVPASVRGLGVEGVKLLDLGDRAHDVVELHAIWEQESRNPALRRIVDILESRGTGRWPSH
jgi:DNA-binding transcriptional LysR family regulator